MNQQYKFAITDTDAGARLDQFLASHIPGLSRSRIQKLITAGQITINTEPANKKHLLEPGEQIICTIPPLEDSQAKPIALDLDIIYEDNNVIVINKPAGLTVHHGAGIKSDEPTLVNALLAHCGDSLSGIGGKLRPGIVHRLDKETSGIMIIAKNDTTHQMLSQQFQDRSVTKKYLTLCYGHLKPAKGQINSPIARDPQNRTKMAISNSKDAREAITNYSVQATHSDDFGSYSMCHIQILTGRTHQIRVHFSSIGFPIVGDSTYGIKKVNEHFRKAYSLKRQFLHAAELTIEIPEQGRKTFKANLPEELSFFTQK